MGSVGSFLDGQARLHRPTDEQLVGFGQQPVRVRLGGCGTAQRLGFQELPGHHATAVELGDDRRQPASGSVELFG
jgi:hypothetical protein